MAVKTGDLESELIVGICDRVREALPEREAAMAESFVRQYYHWVPPSDLAGRSEADLYGAALAQWRLSQTRLPHEAKVRVYNPERDRDGFESPHTVIEIVSDDMPFIVDSVTMELARQGCTLDVVIHPVIRVRRDEQGRLFDVVESAPGAAAGMAESVLHAEVVREHDPGRLVALTEALERLLDEVAAAVGDWQKMRSRMLELADELDDAPVPVDRREVQEVQSFLRWAAEDQFIFLGYREYDLREDSDETVLEVRPESGLGLLRTRSPRPRKPLSQKAA